MGEIRQRKPLPINLDPDGLHATIAELEQRVQDMKRVAQANIDERKEYEAENEQLRAANTNLANTNRELTRQVEQLQAMDVAVRELIAAATDALAFVGYSASVREKVDRLDAALSALTAPPSSSDRGRNDSKGIEGDTGREEK